MFNLICFQQIHLKTIININIGTLDLPDCKCQNPEASKLILLNVKLMFSSLTK